MILSRHTWPKNILILCTCLYFTVISTMPPAVAALGGEGQRFSIVLDTEETTPVVPQTPISPPETPSVKVQPVEQVSHDAPKTDTPKPKTKAPVAPKVVKPLPTPIEAIPAEETTPVRPAAEEVVPVEKQETASQLPVATPSTTATSTTLSEMQNHRYISLDEASSMIHTMAEQKADLSIVALRYPGMVMLSIIIVLLFLIVLLLLRKNTKR